eukprot:353133-Chlamydomonas_euryale.AAC.4
MCASSWSSCRFAPRHDSWLFGHAHSVSPAAGPAPKLDWRIRRKSTARNLQALSTYGRLYQPEGSDSQPNRTCKDSVCVGGAPAVRQQAHQSLSLTPIVIDGLRPMPSRCTWDKPEAARAQARQQWPSRVSQGSQARKLSK